jgi:hypothetical protein
MRNSIFITFTILTELRRDVPPGRIWQIFRRFGESLSPRLPFWLHLCHEAGLLTCSESPRASQYFKVWLALPPETQVRILLEAWLTMPGNKKDRISRRAFLRRLEKGLPLKCRDQRELLAMEAFGFYREERLTAWGRVILLGEPAPTTHSPALWEIMDGVLKVPFPTDWRLLWDLETFLQPAAPGVYPLDKKSLRRASQYGATKFGMDKWEQALIHVLEAGLKAPIPQSLRASILGQPVLQVTEGTILEFSDAKELGRLRHSSVFRNHFDRILSPRHVCIEAQNAPHLLKMLEQRGIYTRPLAEESAEALRTRPHTYFHQTAIPQQMETPPSVTNLLGAYLRLQQALDILYHAPGGVRPENRRITPLLMEERGGQVYVIAYCHTRRAQRTFRLDRIEIPE